MLVAESIPTTVGDGTVALFPGVAHFPERSHSQVGSEFERIPDWPHSSQSFSLDTEKGSRQVFYGIAVVHEEFLLGVNSKLLRSVSPWTRLALWRFESRAPHFGRASFEVKYVLSLQDCCCFGRNPLSLMHYPDAHEYVDTR